MDIAGPVRTCHLISGSVSLSYDLLFPFCRHGNRGLRSHRPETAQPHTPGGGLQGPKTSPHPSHPHVLRQQLGFQKVPRALAQDSQMVSLQAAVGHAQMSQD